MRNPGPLGLRDEQFWSAPFATRDEVEGPLLAAGEEALIVDAPGRVVLEERQTLPLVVLRVAPLPRFAELDFRRHALVVAVELERNRVRVAPALEPIENLALPEQETVDPSSTARAAEAYLVDVRQRLALPWRPATHLLAVLLRDQVSERRRVRVEHSPGVYVDPEAERYRRQELERAGPPAPWPPPDDPLPHYLRGAGSPPLPDGPGIALDLPRLRVLGRDRRCVLHGSFRLPVLAHHRLPAERRREGGARGVVPVTLVATGSRHAGPWVVDLVVPVSDAAADGGEPAAGYFHLDLLDHLEPGPAEQTLFVYAVSAEVLAGPWPVAFVHPVEPDR